MADEKYIDADGLEHILRKQKPTAVPIPTDPSQLTFKYTGQVIKPTFPDIDSTLVIIDCPNSINVGTYTARIKLKNTVKTCWSDGTTYDKDITYYITKADGTMTVNKNSATLTVGSPSTTATCSSVKGTLSTSSTDTAIATASINGTTITINAVGFGNCTINVTDSGNDAYAPVTRNISITSQYYKIVSWANGTDREIVNIVKAADAGLVNLQTNASWAVGDERTINGNVWVLMHAKHSTYGHNFVVGTKNAIAKVDNLPSGSSYNGGDVDFGSSTVKAACNNIYSGLPSSIKSIFKNFSVSYLRWYFTKRSSSYVLNSQTKSTSGYILVENNNEIGIEDYGRNAFTYYATGANRIKKYNNASCCYYVRDATFQGSSFGTWISLGRVKEDGSGAPQGYSDNDALSVFGVI